MPAIPEDLFIDSLRELIGVDRAWIPTATGASLYIRPFLFSVDEYIGIRPSQAFTYMVILSPVGFYYSTPVRVKIETHFTRAAHGGTGYAKTGGNYGGAVYPARLAQEVALQADRSDITEELVRLESHCVQFEQIVTQRPEGRQLQFLLQEVVRELNTIASKAQHAEIQQYVVEAKAEAERLREQVQNVE